MKRQYRYGYTVFFNTNICRTNTEDVKQLVEIAHDNVAHCYDVVRVMKGPLKQARHGFQGVTGSFE